jgi:type IV pilus assembly protein PilO
MPKNSSAVAQKAGGPGRDPKLIVRIVLGVVLATNLVAAALVLFPPGGSAEDLQREATTLQAQISANQGLLERTRQHEAGCRMVSPKPGCHSSPNNRPV